MSAQCRLTIGRILALVLVASLFVSPVAGAQTASGADKAVPAAPTALAPGDVRANPPLEDIASISAGHAYTCVVTNSGGVKCWGSNSYGQLGDGTAEDWLSRSFPADVIGLTSGIAAVEGGTDSTCALTTAGGVKCWGNNWFGQMGDGTTTARLTPVDVAGLGSGVKALAVGGAHTCALSDAGGVECWGNNWVGQVGDGTTITRTVPVDVAGLGSGVKALAAGGAHTCALTGAGGVECWGNNWFGQMGDGTNITRTVPADVIGLSGVKAIAAGDAHTCALTDAGGVKCWGRNDVGQLGDGTSESHLVPVDVCAGSDAGCTATLSGIVAIAAGWGHTCALDTGGAVKCWGYNWSSQLGDGTTTNRSSPTDVIGLVGGVKALAAGGEHTCTLTDGGRVYCWGANNARQIGVTWKSTRTLPADVTALTSGVAALAAGAGQTCALTGSGGLKCWGVNTWGQVGDGTTTYRGAPVDVTGLSSGVAAVSAGTFHTCAVTQGGGMKCWGGNDSCQVGDGTQGTNRKTPVDVAGLTSGVTGIAAGNTFSCAVVNGGAKCWGSPVFGQLGDGTYMLRKTPVDVVGLSSGVTAVAAGVHHACALTSGGGIKCWGWNEAGMLGDGTTSNSNTPVDVVGLSSGVKAIAVGGPNCALRETGGVKCWGGLVGDGTFTPRLTPVDVCAGGAAGCTATLSGVKALAGGVSHMCALTSGGGVKCWGVNPFGQLGDGTQANRTIPVDVIGLTSGVTALAAGANTTCALVGDGRPKCWGDDGSTGAAGGGYAAPITTPTEVLVAAPELAVNYASGKPGSVFTLTGAYFPPNTALNLTVNGVPLGTTPTTTAGTGEFLIFVDTAAADAGAYVVTVGTDPAADSGFILLPGAPLRGQEGGGAAVVTIPAGLAAPVNTLAMPLVLN